MQRHSRTEMHIERIHAYWFDAELRAANDIWRIQRQIEKQIAQILAERQLACYRAG